MSIRINGNELECDSYTVELDDGKAVVKLKGWTKNCYETIQGFQKVMAVQTGLGVEPSVQVDIKDKKYHATYFDAKRLNDKVLKTWFNYRELDKNNHIKE